ncbi:MAG: hypothetical protein Q7R64_01995 [bacterium]|nr:hypothetical protein [bacterium]
MIEKIKQFIVSFPAVRVKQGKKPLFFELAKKNIVKNKGRLPTRLSSRIDEIVYGNR